MNSISLVIPTKNRINSLLNLLHSIENQTLLPNEIIIVDQSDLKIAPSNLDGFKKLNIIYHYDRKISGLVEAKSRGVQLSNCDFIGFLDDDSDPDSNYLTQMIAGFANSDAVGMCANVINYEHTSYFLKPIYKFFNRGFFRGARIGLFGVQGEFETELVKTHQISGGCSMWRSYVFSYVEFDLGNKFHFFEDIDFSYRVHKYYGGKLYINTNAKILDLYKTLGPRNYGEQQYGRMLESVALYFKYKKSGDINLFDYTMYLVGRFLESFFYLIKTKSVIPVGSFFRGLSDGYNYSKK